MEPSIHEPIGARPSPVRREAFVAFLALGVLGAVCVLAFCAPAEKVALSDQVTLLFLALAAAFLWWPALLHKLETQPGAATFFLTSAMFVIYSLARRVLPENGWSLRFAALPDDEYIFSFSAYLVALGALLTSPLWWRSGSTWTRALLLGLGIVASFSVFSFWLLSRFYPVGAAQRLDPSSLPNLFLMIVEYGCVALLCRAVCFDIRARRLALRVLPLVLFALWARFHFIKTRAEDAT